MSARLAILLAYAALSFTYGLINPPFESPDEILHYEYIETLLRTRRLPVAEPSAGLTEFHQPPLYYLTGALLTAWLPNGEPARAVVQPNPYWGWRSGAVGVDNKNQYVVDPTLAERHPALWWRVRVLRLVSTVLGLAVVWCAGRLARRWQPERPALAVMAMAFVAFLPQFLLVSSSISNDIAAIALSALSVDLATRWLCEPERRLRLAVGLGVCLGAAVLVKVNLILLWVLVAGMMVAFLALRAAGDPGGRVANIGAVIALPVLIAGPYAWRNWQLYGDPTALSRMDLIWGRREPPLSLAQTLATEVPNTWTSFWARFGYGQIPVPDGLYAACLLLVIIAMIGVTPYLVRHWPAMPVERRWLLAFLLLTLGAYVAATVRYSQTSLTGAQGRFLFPALSVIGVLLSLGWMQVANAVTVSAQKLTVGFAIAWLGFAIWALWAILLPAYHVPLLMLSESEIAQPSGMRMGDVALVRRVRLLNPPLQPGADAMIEIEWLALQATPRPLSAFVQLLGPGEVKLGARDSYPGLGRVSTSVWRSGQVVVDHVSVPVDAGVARELAPAQIRIAVGLYDLATGERLPVDPPVLSLAKLPPPPEAVRPSPFPTGLATFGEALQLDVVNTPETVAASGALVLDLEWTALGPLPCDCAVFVHVLDGEANAPVAQRDASILDGRYPGEWWAAGERFVEQYTIPIPETLAPGSYALVIGLYDRSSGERLPVRTPGSEVLDDRFQIGTVRVVR